jgi:hypothetical protein
MQNYFITDYNPNHIDYNDHGDGSEGIVVETAKLPEIESSIEDPYNQKPSSTTSSSEEEDSDPFAKKEPKEKKEVKDDTT